MTIHGTSGSPTVNFCELLLNKTIETRASPGSQVLEVLETVCVYFTIFRMVLARNLMPVRSETGRVTASAPVFAAEFFLAVCGSTWNIGEMKTSRLQTY